MVSVRPVRIFCEPLRELFRERIERLESYIRNIPCGDVQATEITTIRHWIDDERLAVPLFNKEAFSVRFDALGRWLMYRHLVWNGSSLRYRPMGGTPEAASYVAELGERELILRLQASGEDEFDRFAHMRAARTVNENVALLQSEIAAFNTSLSDIAVSALIQRKRHCAS